MTNQCVDVLKKGVRPRVASSDFILGRKWEDEGVHVKLQCHMRSCKAERAVITLDHFKERMKVAEYYNGHKVVIRCLLWVLTVPNPDSIVETKGCSSY